MTAVDTSVCVAALLEWHEFHNICRPAARGALIPAHVRAETYAVLTRLPAGQRLDAPVAATLLTSWFPTGSVLSPSPELQAQLVERLVSVGVHGGATYDGLVALTAAERAETLVTCDVRARVTYERLGIDFELLDTGR